MVSPDLGTFAVDLTAGLADVGAAQVSHYGTVSITAKSDGTRSFTFRESADEIRRRITIDDAAWHAMWPGWTLEKASIGMFSVHVQEAIDTAPDSATTLTLVEGSVIVE
ncbi:hypothetical protein ACFVTE_14330 [Arthrobacter sp. NPDC058097]|uniref:hypothetical protein n=1 Tax=Arthrobacter sp. NPDC058097 TaxID=3346340 RepID=UPI0036DF735A